jgi:lysophospholipase L1-like esterase
MARRLKLADWIAIAFLVASLTSLFPPSIRWDFLNVIPAAAAVYLLWRVLQSADRVRLKAVLLVAVLMLCIIECSARVLSYQRALIYERAGDLPFTPVPNQVYTEKISLASSRINAAGFREPSPLIPGRRTILCLGDSITYGYAMLDNETWPAQLGQALDQSRPDEFNVLNGGVNAYPMSFIHQKFLYHWNRGIHPDFVLVGYSMNEGWLGALVDADDDAKDTFERRVLLKNAVRSFALYNLVVENWARHVYESLRYKLVPGTNFTETSKTELDGGYDRYLDRFVKDLQARHVTPIFVLFAALDGETLRYDTLGPYQRRFAAFAEAHEIPLIRTDDVLRAENGGNPDIASFFFDPGHMTSRGNQVVGRRLAAWLSGFIGPDLGPSTQSAPSQGRERTE